MRKITCLLLLVSTLPYYVKSQILPKENSKLNYRLIGFSFPSESSSIVCNCKIEIAEGNHNTGVSFKKNIVKTLNCETNKIIIEVPSFGSEYTWRIIYKGSHSKTTISALHHFSTTAIPFVDTTNARLRIVKSAETYKDGYVFLDGSRTMYDMNGSPVWYLPDIEGSMTPGSSVRDLKHTSQGTITFLVGNQAGFKAYEINYNGDILWKGSDDGKVSGDKTEDYHHEFTRLANGHYMVLGNEWTDVFLKVTSKKDSSLLIGKINNNIHSDTIIKLSHKPYGTLIEYDENGNVVWSYKSSGYFNGSDIINHRDVDGSIDVNVHDNAFFFDEKDKIIYISFKDINRIIKIKYPEGTIINTYGEIYKRGVSDNDNRLFCGQHCCRRSEDGYLYLFNNNACNAGMNPKLTVMQEPSSQNDSLKMIWEYECTNDGLSTTELNNLTSVSGGSVFELPDHSIFACMGNMHSKVFIVNRDKKVLWSAIPEIWDKGMHRWDLLTQYRADIIQDRNVLEKLIWNNELQ